MIQRQQELLSTARAAGRELTAEEQTEFNNLQRDIDAIRAAGQQPNNAPQTAEPEDNSESVRTAERQRCAEITALCRDFNVSAEDTNRYMAEGTSVDAVRAAILDGMRQNGTPISQRGSVNVTCSEEDKYRDAAADALLMRSGQTVERPADGADQLRSMSLRDIGIECLARDGSRNMNSLLRMDSDTLYTELSRQFYNPSAAFPAILDQTIRKSIVHLYNHVPTTFQAFTTKGSLKDFKETSDHEYVIGGVGDFLLVPENGEIKADKPRTELLPTRKLDTYGKQFSMTRQAFINDDIGFLTEVPGLYATKAKQTIDKQVYSLLFNNASIFDGTPLFSTAHNNLISTGSAPSQASIQAMITKMQLQHDQFGEAIYITPKTIIVPVGYEFDLAVIFHSAQVTGSNNNDINPLYNYPFQIVQSPVLNALAGENACPWFMVADSTSARGIQVDYLNGQETPTVRRMETPGQLGFIWDIYLDWGISVRDYRGIAMNPGVALTTE
ncbi:MAG: hypothetical protein LUG61_04965 [Lachnospiraceae bacterium]|nr:hypothetical protein [Lachnospiraceae bacterium]